MMESEDITLRRELRELENDRKIFSNTLEAKKIQMADMLKGEMGTDMNDVLSGKKTVELTKKEKFIYKLNFYIDKFFKMF